MTVDKQNPKFNDLYMHETMDIPFIKDNKIESSHS